MKMFFIFLSTVVLGVTWADERVRRQIWPAPGNPNFFWNGPGFDRNDFFDNGNFWMGPQRFDQSSNNQNGFRNEFNSVGGGNRRTTTESSGPFSTTPRTIHVAPQGCPCPMTQQFNPVCGTDGNTYRNKGLLNCYVRCGTNVSQKRLGTC